VTGVPLYIDVLMLLNFLVDLLLLVAANRLSGYPTRFKRVVLAAILGGVYGGVCILPGLRFLAETLWRIISLALMAGISYGFCKEAMRRGALFVLLSMSLGGVAVGLESGGLASLVLAALGVCLMCMFGLRGKFGTNYVQVQIDDLHLIALRDTGNTLTDPLTGQQILVVSANVGQRLLGLTAAELSDPVEVIGRVPGLRLVPFHAVGCNGGVLPVKRFENVKIGSWSGSCLVAFAPNELGRGEAYEALTGGAV
jgi:stage II sporulation protein GA (sporulation sigma-E factor processing peptidase)